MLILLDLIIKLINLKTSASAALLDNKGPISQQLKQYAERQVQQDMATLVEHAIDSTSVLVCEAGTGTGKTFAYLVPALLSHKKIIISTCTKHLQEQLYARDLPFIMRALGFDKKTALLKGRSNYVCLYRLSNQLSEGLFDSKAQIKQVQRIRQWSVTTQVGDLSELSGIPEKSNVWPLVTSTHDNCLGSNCPHIGDCYVVKARKKALAADVLVVNHHLFFADMRLKDEGVGELLPTVGAIILDEAHHIVKNSIQFFGEGFSSRQLFMLIKDITQEQKNLAADDNVLIELSMQLKDAVSSMHIILSDKQLPTEWDGLKHQQAVVDIINEIEKRFNELVIYLEKVSVRSPGLANCWHRCCLLADQFKLLTSQTSEQYIQWHEMFAHNFAIHLTPLSIANEFQKLMKDSDCAWIFTSATLSVSNSFTYFCDALGLQDGNMTTVCLSSPFNYPEQALMYVPRGLSEPNHSQYTQDCLLAALPVIKLCQGRTLMLFTSFKALDIAADILADQLSYPLLIQGEEPKTQLLDKFISLAPAVLLGTTSFWEGIDISGDALSCVFIDKLPFASPGDPLNKARSRAMAKQGKHAFSNYQLPQAVLMLKQGAGRLIRSINDKGILMICDPRLVSKSYGQAFVTSLPPMQRTRELNKVSTFLNSTELHEELID